MSCLDHLLLNAPHSCTLSPLSQNSHLSLTSHNKTFSQRMYFSQIISHNHTSHNSLLTTHFSQLTSHNSLRTTHFAQLTSHNSHVSQLTSHNSHVSQLTSHNSHFSQLSLRTTGTYVSVHVSDALASYHCDMCGGTFVIPIQAFSTSQSIHSSNTFHFKHEGEPKGEPNLLTSPRKFLVRPTKGGQLPSL